MEITNVYETEKGMKLESHLKSFKNLHTEGTVDIWGHKLSVQVKGMDLFHKLAKETGAESIRRSGNRISFYMEDSSDTWTICLNPNQGEDFLKKYGEHYKIE